MRRLPYHLDWGETWVFCDAPFKVWFDDEIDRWKLMPYPHHVSLRDDLDPESAEAAREERLWIDRIRWLGDHGLWRREFESREQAATTLTDAAARSPMPTGE